MLVFRGPKHLFGGFSDIEVDEVPRGVIARILDAGDDVVIL